jgi:hypothetical protein
LCDTARKIANLLTSGGGGPLVREGLFLCVRVPGFVSAAGLPLSPGLREARLRPLLHLMGRNGVVGGIGIQDLTEVGMGYDYFGSLQQDQEPLVPIFYANNTQHKRKTKTCSVSTSCCLFFRSARAREIPI